MEFVKKIASSPHIHMALLSFHIHTDIIMFGIQLFMHNISIEQVLST